VSGRGASDAVRTQGQARRRPGADTVGRLAGALIVLVLIGWGLGEVCESLLQSADLHAVRSLAADRSDTLNGLMRAVTWAGSTVVLVPLAVLSCLLLGRRGRVPEAVAIAVSLAGAVLLFNVIKLLVARPRPPVSHLQGVTSTSFPSGHATQACAFYLSLLLAFLATGHPPRVSAGAIGGVVLLVFAIALSRAYLGVHYPSDIVAGALLGASWTVTVWRTLVGPPRVVRARARA